MMNKRIRELAEQAESKSEMLRLLAKRHNMRVLDDSLREYTRAISAAKIALGDLFNIDEEE
jgi:hypothetical protein